VGFVLPQVLRYLAGTDFSNHVPRRRARAREYSSGEAGTVILVGRGRATVSISSTGITIILQMLLDDDSSALRIVTEWGHLPGIQVGNAVIRPSRGCPTATGSRNESSSSIELVARLGDSA